MRALLFLSLAGLATASQLPLRPPTLAEAPTRPTHGEDVLSYLDLLGKRFHLPGISVAIVRLGEEPVFYNWGNASESGIPSSEDTLYGIASNSKAFTSTSLGLVLDDFATGKNATPLPSGLSKVDWSTPVSQLLGEDEWALMDEYAGNHAQLRDLLSHGTGMPRHDLSYSPHMTLKQLVHSLRYLRPTFELREEWQYNNMMYATASYLVSRLSFQSYTSFVHSRLFNPLNMSSSTYLVQDAFFTGRLAENWVYQAGPGMNETRRIPHFMPDWSGRAAEVNAGAGGVITSTRDLVQWVTTLLNGGVYPASGEQVIPLSVLDKVMSARMAFEPKPAFPELSAKAYGAGWWRYSYAGHSIVQHSGNVPGFTSRISLLPEQKLGIISLTNGDGKDPAIESLHYRIMENELGLEHLDWPSRFEQKLKEQSAARLQLNSNPEAQSVEAYPNLAKYAGTYSAPGYFENLTLCAWPYSLTPACNLTFSAYSATYGAAYDLERSHTLYATWQSMWTTHLRLVARPGSEREFELYIDTLYPYGAGENKSPFYFRWEIKGSEAEFELVGGEVTGLGMWGLEAGPRERVPGMPRESSEAFFERVVGLEN